MSDQPYRDRDNDRRVIPWLLFGLLVVFTSRWTVFEQEDLESHAANRRPLLEQMRIPRGDIVARNGTVLAHSNASGSGSNRTPPAWPLVDSAWKGLPWSRSRIGEAMWHIANCTRPMRPSSSHRFAVCTNGL